MTETWVVYKAESMDSQGWENRQLSPSGALTDILAEEWNSSETLPEIGKRVREYINLQTPGDGITHGKDGDWFVSRIHHFSSFDTEQRILVCYCTYQPIASEWQALKRGDPVSEMLKTVSSSKQ